LEIVKSGGGKVEQITQGRPSVRDLDTLFGNISDTICVVVPDVEKHPDLYNNVKKLVDATKKKPAIYTVEVILFLFYIFYFCYILFVFILFLYNLFD
jgi:hypothetical protein